MATTLLVRNGMKKEGSVVDENTAAQARLEPPFAHDMDLRIGGHLGRKWGRKIAEHNDPRALAHDGCDHLSVTNERRNDLRAMMNAKRQIDLVKESRTVVEEKDLARKEEKRITLIRTLL